MIDRKGHIVYPKWIDELANYIGNARRLNNTDLYNENPNKKRGDKDEFVHPLGIKGELIAALYLYKNNIDYEMNRILDNKPIVEHDILVSGSRRVDVKTIRPDGWDCLVTVSSHNNAEKQIDSYMFIQILDETNARYWIFRHEEVGKWETKETKGNGFCNLNYYKPLKSIE